jgi:hypothetical protein
MRLSVPILVPSADFLAWPRYQSKTHIYILAIGRCLTTAREEPRAKRAPQGAVASERRDVWAR